MQVPTKPWYKSKLFWLGALEILAGVAELAISYLESPEAGVAFIVKGLLTIYGRYVTKQPMTFTGKFTKQVLPVISMLFLLPFGLLACSEGEPEHNDTVVNDTTTELFPGGGDREVEVEDSER